MKRILPLPHPKLSFDAFSGTGPTSRPPWARFRKQKHLEATGSSISLRDEGACEPEARPRPWGRSTQDLGPSARGESGVTVLWSPSPRLCPCATRVALGRSLRDTSDCEGFHRKLYGLGLCGTIEHRAEMEPSQQHLPAEHSKRSSVAVASLAAAVRSLILIVGARRPWPPGDMQQMVLRASLETSGNLAGAEQKISHCLISQNLY